MKFRPKFSLGMLMMVVFGAAVMGAIAYSFMPQPVGVDVAVVGRGPLSETVDEDGKTRIRERYVVSSPLAGRLLRIELKPGHKVHADETLLATIEPQDPALLDARARTEAEARVSRGEAAKSRAEKQLDRSNTALEFAEKELRRVERLEQQRGVSRDELEVARREYQLRLEEKRVAEFDVGIAEYELKLADAVLNHTLSDAPFDIYSPISGNVLRVFQESTAVVAPGTQLLEVGNPRDLEMEVDVLSSDAVQIQPGDKVLLRHWGGENVLSGVVRLIEPSGFTKLSALGVEEQRVNVILDFADPPEKWESLGDGYRVDAQIVVWEDADVLKVPISALFRHGDQWAVFLIEENKAKLQTVQIGRRGGLEAQVLEGLQPGDELIVHPSDKITAGAAIFRREGK